MSKIGTAIIKLINPLFKRPVHPFNLKNQGVMTYADWQFDQAEKTIKYYTGKYSAEELFSDKDVLDCGCGEAGKTVYYATLGAKKVTGVDVFPEYAVRAADFARKKGMEDRFEFRLADATRLPFDDAVFDTIIMNDFIEHVSDPQSALQEAMRVLKPGGRIYTNFPPYYHPYGMHMQDVIGILWPHFFFSEESLISAYKEYVKELPDGEERMHLRFSVDEEGNESISYLNKMTIQRFETILDCLHIHPLYYKITPLRPFLKPLLHSHSLREGFTRMVTCVIEKERRE